MKKGFTLIELLAVIVILAIIAVITVPIILNIVNDTRKNAKIRSTEGIIKSAKNYYAQSLIRGNEVSEKIFLFDEGKPVELEYDGESPESGVLKMDEDGNIAIAIKYDKWCLTKGIKDKTIKAENYEEGKCLIPDILKDPVITLIGDETLRIKQNNEYVELGVIAKTVEGDILDHTREIKLNDIIVDEIDTSEFGREYIITYRARSNDKEAIATRRVIIIDGIAPVITVPEDTIIKTNEVLDYDLMNGVTVTDNSGITPTITYTGSLSAIPGEYEIIYKAIDDEGNETTKVRIITVKNSVVTIEEEMEESDEVMTNDPDGNPRYVGLNPRNYVLFNGELWRIIGVFNGQTKIIRNDIYATTHWAIGFNSNWDESNVKTVLNTTFWNTVDSTSKQYVDTNYVWRLGTTYADTLTRALMYSAERSAVVFGSHPKTFTGAIGLMYPSDFGYASSSTENYCNTVSMANWHEETYIDCKNNNWLLPVEIGHWTITSITRENGQVFVVWKSGMTINIESRAGQFSIKPVLYLKSNVKIKDGQGTYDDPFILEI